MGFFTVDLNESTNARNSTLKAGDSYIVVFNADEFEMILTCVKVRDDIVTEHTTELEDVTSVSADQDVIILTAN